MTFPSKQLLAPLIAFGALWAVCLLVSMTGGLPEPLGSIVGQNLSRLGNALFLVFGIGWILFSPLEPGDSRLLRVASVVIAIAAYALIVLATKHLWYFPRPGQPALRTEGSRGSGFPSGHTVPVFEIACLVGSISPRLRIPMLTLAVLIGYSRVEVGAHYAYQVVLSGALGTVPGVAIGLWRNHVLNNFRHKTLAPTAFP